LRRGSNRAGLALLLTALLPVLLPAAAAAQRRPGNRPDSAPQASRAADAERLEVPKYVTPKPEEKTSVTHHQITVNGTTLAYTATAGTLLLKEENGRPRASVFYVYYARDGVKDLGKRPITYTFNGGPGSASVWLHLGAFGPRRVVMEGPGDPHPPVPPAPPYQIVDNAETLLDVTDLVFIDPVTTGFSREVPGEDAQQFHGVQEDLESVGEFIRLWTARFSRWQSPKFLAGESYGTTRAAGLSHYLQQRHGIYLNGIVLLSSILNFETASFDAGNDLPYPLFLPTYTAIAWYHGRLPEELQRAGLRPAVEEAERFALGDYTLALAQGVRLPAQAQNDIAKRLARLTGLSPEYLLRANLRPEIQAFCKELLRGERKTVGRLDGRFQGLDRDAAGESSEFDPSYAAIQGPFTAALNHYVADELGFKSDLPYEILTDRVRPWSYRESSNRYLNVAEDLRRAMAENPSLKIFVGKGFYDLATPFFAAQYTFEHLGFDPGYLQRVTTAEYEAGHMMYIRKADREKLKADVTAFLRGAAGGQP
jgi:carboxypeptidase C (cathepsin A)